MIRGALRFIMLFTRRRDGSLFALKCRVNAPHQALHFGKFPHHLGEQIGLAQLGGANSFCDIGPHQRRNLASQRYNPRNALRLRADFFMKDNVLEFTHAAFELVFSVGIPEEFSIRQAGAHHALIASDNGLAAIARLNVGGEQEFIGEFIALIQHKAFLVSADGGADHLRRNIQKLFFKTAHQDLRPFHQPRDLMEQAVIFHQLQPLRHGQIFGVMQDNLAAALRIQHHFGFFQLGRIIIKAAHNDRIRCHKTMAIGDIAGFYPVNLKWHHLGFFHLRAKHTQNRMQGAHPAQAGRRL